MIRLENVVKTYPESDAPALNGLSLHIRKGEFVFVLGSSGAGKSTLIKLLLREVTADSGRVTVNGFNLKKIRQRKIPYLRRSMGVVFQDFRLIPTMTAAENVAFAMRVTNVPEREIRDRVPFVLGLVGLGDKMDRYPEHLSGGEQQRVALARALVHSPQLIIADEPTGNIDPALSIEIMELLAAINSVGVTVVVVTHEHELVQRFHKRVIQIEHGQVVADTDPPKEDEFEQEIPRGSGLEALNRLAEEQRRQTGAAWGTDANLHIQLPGQQSAQKEGPAAAAQPVPVPEEPAEDEAWREEAQEEPFVTTLRRRAAPKEKTAEKPTAEQPTEQPDSAPQHPAEEVRPTADATAAPPQATDTAGQSAAAQKDGAAAQHSTTMADVDELLRQLGQG